MVEGWGEGLREYWQAVRRWVGLYSTHSLQLRESPFVNVGVLQVVQGSSIAAKFECVCTRRATGQEIRLGHNCLHHNLFWQHEACYLVLRVEVRACMSAIVGHSKSLG